MAIITISRGSYSKGKEVAEKVAQKLGYTCISRDLLVEAAEHFNIPEIKLVRALHDAPSILERFTYGKERYLAYIESTLLQHARKDDLVYHGLAGHFILRGIQHILNVRILANIEDRVRHEMEREGISWDDALYLLKKDDHERRQWSLKLYGIDTTDPSLYDLVIHIDKITVADAVGIICHTAGLPAFRTAPESQKDVDDLALAARVKAHLVALVPSVEVTAHEGKVFIDARAGLTEESDLAREVQKRAEQVPGVKEVGIHIIPTTVYT